MRILIVNYEFPPIGGGGGIATYYIARELCRKGHSVSVLTSRFRELRWHEELEDIQIYRVPVLRKRRDYCSVLEMATFILSSLPMLFYLLLTRKFDLLHIFFGVPSGPWRRCAGLSTVSIQISVYDVNAVSQYPLAQRGIFGGQ